MTPGTTLDRYGFAAQEDRCAPRTKLAIPSQFRPSGSKGFQTVVQDLSLSGFSCMSINRINPGTVVWLTMRGLQSLQSEVIWWNNSLVGCAFHDLISPLVLDNLIARWRSDGVYRSVP